MDGQDTGRWTSHDELVSEVRNRYFAPGPYVRGSLLGSGGWSMVYKVRRLRDGALFAGKTSHEMQQLRHEAANLRSLHHKNILKFIDWHEDPKPCATLLVTELCLGGTLQTKIDNCPEGIRRSETLQVVLQCSQALEFIHSKNRFHCDIKPRNILIRTWDPVDIAIADCADIKLATYSGKIMGTQAFWSPHMASQRRYKGTSDDIWALGITLLGMVAQLPPVRTKQELAKYFKKCFEHCQRLKALNKGDGIVSLLSEMLVWKAEQRATASKCVHLSMRTIAEETRNRGTKNSNELDLKSPEDFRPISFW